MHAHNGIWVWDILAVAPPIIPEPTTLLLVGSGLVALGTGVLRDARKRNSPRSTLFHSIDAH
ncbi:MAG: PEP-CTERM sorting domain-containing protein [Chloroflexi bacterium]|nr:PEP-CTERM sorting domain-containing protein [Chloroflexota bacterium]